MSATPALPVRQAMALWLKITVKIVTSMPMSTLATSTSSNVNPFLFIGLDLPEI
jgi:hypothetical protein